jgi:hypothetical protein
MNLGTVSVDGVRRTLSHVFIQIGSPDSRCGTTQYHEIAYITARGEFEVIDSHLDADTAQTLFRLMNSGALSIDTRIEITEV